VLRYLPEQAPSVPSPLAEQRGPTPLLPPAMGSRGCKQSSSHVNATRGANPLRDKAIAFRSHSIAHARERCVSLPAFNVVARHGMNLTQQPQFLRQNL
jgi:hypothetical protein